MVERYSPGFGHAVLVGGGLMGAAIAGALIGILVDQGRVALADPAVQYLPQWASLDPQDPRRLVTVEHLLRMTSGLQFDERGALLSDWSQVRKLPLDPGPRQLGTVLGEGGTAIFRNFSQFPTPFPAISPLLPFACPPCVLVGALCVPCAEVLLLEASAGLVRHRNFSAISRNFPAIFRNLISRSQTAIPPPPLLPCTTLF